MSRDEELILQEASALAQWGRVDEALELLTRVMGEKSDDEAPGPIPLLRARLLWAAGDATGRARACSILEKLGDGALGRAGGEGWRAMLELSRIHRESGDLVSAAGSLTKALDGFRASDASRGPLADALAGLITVEVNALKSSSQPSAGPGSGADAAAARGTETSNLERKLLLRLVSLGRRLATEDDPDHVLRIVLHEAIDLAGAERGFVVTVHDQEFRFELAENLDWSEVHQPSFEVSRTLVRGVVRERKPVILNLSEVEGGDPAKGSLADRGVRCVACIPLLNEEDVLGALYLDARGHGWTLDRSLTHLFEMFAAQAAAALANAREHRAKERALETAEATIRKHRSETERRVRYEELVGASDAMQEVYRKLDLIVTTEMPVVVLGETGTGKEMVARLIHFRGPRRQREFVAANCAGMAETLLESELFGHERGAFTGAERSRPGLFEVADKGTLFLDEVGDMSPRMQADLLRVLQSGEMRRVGARDTIHVDVRIVAATHRDLESMVRRGEFRQDLYFRLNVLCLRLPPLRDRADDIPVLAHELLAGMLPSGAPFRFSDRAMRRLLAYPWPGNVRELQNVLRRLMVLNVDPVEEQHLPPEVLLSGVRSRRPGSLRSAEDEAVRRALEAAHGNKAEAARILGVDRKTLYARLHRLEGAGAARQQGRRGVHHRDR